MNTILTILDQHTLEPYRIGRQIPLNDHAAFSVGDFVMMKGTGDGDGIFQVTGVDHNYGPCGVSSTLTVRLPPKGYGRL